jgi:hypothetical protein
MRHFYTVEWFDNEKHAWACRSHSDGLTEFLVFTGDKEPFAGDKISVSYTKPIISEGVFLKIEN